MTTTDPRDAARVELILAELRLPAIRRLWAGLAGQADKEGWPATRFLAALAEHEVAERGRRRIKRHLAEARLPVGRGHGRRFGTTRARFSTADPLPTRPRAS
jgi:DNA replication protein DnaC